MRLMTPPLPAASRPSKSTTTLSLLLHDPVLQLDQLALQPKQLVEIAAAIERVGRRAMRHVGAQLVEARVVELHLQLLVEAVGIVGVAHRARDLVVGHGASVARARAADEGSTASADRRRGRSCPACSRATPTGCDRRRRRAWLRCRRESRARVAKMPRSVGVSKSQAVCVHAGDVVGLGLVDEARRSRRCRCRAAGWCRSDRASGCRCRCRCSRRPRGSSRRRASTNRLSPRVCARSACRRRRDRDSAGRGWRSSRTRRARRSVGCSACWCDGTAALLEVDGRVVVDDVCCAAPAARGSRC